MTPPDPVTPPDAGGQTGSDSRAESGTPPASDVEPEPEIEPEPEFGLLDVVEAFTALRQEYRNQTREGRQLLQWVETAGRRLEDVSHKLSQLTAARQPPESDERPGEREWVDVLVEIDLAMTRAVDATERALAAATEKAPSGSAGQLRQIAAASAEAFGRLGWLRRRLARPLHEQFQAEIRRRLRDGQGSAPPDPTVEGLRMFVDRVRQLLSQQGIDRRDTLGQPFDPETMNAVEAVSTPDHAPGLVVRQLSPAYHWRGQPIRFAEVCVARSP